MQRSMRYALRVQRPGQGMPTILPFESPQAVEKHIKLLLKRHFVGKLEPLIWNDETWEIDQERLGALTAPAHEDTQAILRQAAMLFSGLAKHDRLTQEQEQEIAEMLVELLGSLHLSAMFLLKLQQRGLTQE